MDVHSRATRSYNMSRIRSRDTKPEMRVRKLCHSLGLRFRLNDPKLPGKPDLTFKKYRTVIMVHGCFWHSHSCKAGSVTPKTNAEFWSDKRQKTVERDAKKQRELQVLGWKVITIWECETKVEESLRRKIVSEFNLKDVSNEV